MLRPAVKRIAMAGITANQVTVFAGVASAVIGVGLCHAPQQWFLILPAFLLLRMALNAVDGMLAREFGQKSDLGAYLNELTDVFSDCFLYLPFAYLAEFDPLWIGIVIVLAVICEMTGVVGVLAGSNRRYDGPMGKSDRAFAFGVLALYIGLGCTVSNSAAMAFAVIVASLLAWTIVNRVRSGLQEKRIT